MRKTHHYPFLIAQRRPGACSAEGVSQGLEEAIGEAAWCCLEHGGGCAFLVCLAVIRI